jgi:sulfur carrier protein ThiS
MVVKISLHTILQKQSPPGPVDQLELHLAENASVSDVLRALDIDMDSSGLILVIDHRVVNENTQLVDGDRLDIIPAISGG